MHIRKAFKSVEELEVVLGALGMCHKHVVTSSTEGDLHMWFVMGRNTPVAEALVKDGSRQFRAGVRDEEAGYTTLELDAVTDEILAACAAECTFSLDEMTRDLDSGDEERIRKAKLMYLAARNPFIPEPDILDQLISGLAGVIQSAMAVEATKGQTPN